MQCSIFKTSIFQSNLISDLFVKRITELRYTLFYKANYSDYYLHSPAAENSTDSLHGLIWSNKLLSELHIWAIKYP